MDATTTRASTVIRSMPTSEMRTQASITIPLSSILSRTSIKLDPPETLSTAIRGPPSLVSIGSLHAFCANSGPLSARHTGPWRRPGKLGPPYHFFRRLRGEIGVVPPPIETYGFSLINRTDKQADADRQHFHVRQRNADVARDHESLVEDSIKNIEQVGCSGNRRNSLHKYLRKIRKRSGTGRIPAIHVTAS